MLTALALALVNTVATGPATADPQAATTYRTVIRERYQAFGYNGTLVLRISHGYVNGTYRPDTDPVQVLVHGGSKGNSIWLDIPTLGGMLIDAHVENGIISGIGTSHTNNLPYVFTATPQPSNP